MFMILLRRGHRETMALLKGRGPRWDGLFERLWIVLSVRGRAMLDKVCALLG